MWWRRARMTVAAPWTAPAAGATSRSGSSAALCSCASRRCQVRSMQPLGHPIGWITTRTQCSTASQRRVALYVERSMHKVCCDHDCEPRAGGRAPRAYQDERYSYVVLRRGPRPAPSTDLRIAQHLAHEPTPDPEQYRTEPARLGQRSAAQQVVAICLVPHISCPLHCAVAYKTVLQLPCHCLMGEMM